MRAHSAGILRARATWQGGLEVLALAALLAAIAGFVRAPRWRVAAVARARRALSAPSFRRSADARRSGLFRDPDRARRGRRRGFAVRAPRERHARLSQARDRRHRAVESRRVDAVRVRLRIAEDPAHLHARCSRCPRFAARQMPLSVFLWRDASRRSAASSAPRSPRSAHGFSASPRARIVVSGFDPWWYGLRGEYVLVAGGSVFKSLDLVAPVNYYPKLYELLLIPVSGLHDTSVIEGISIMRARAVRADLHGAAEAVRARFPHARAARRRLRDRAGDRERGAFAQARSLRGVGAAARVPRRARVLARGPVSAAYWIIAAFALAFASKLSAPPFIVAILAGTLGVWLYNGRPQRAEAGFGAPLRDRDRASPPSSSPRW